MQVLEPEAGTSFCCTLQSQLPRIPGQNNFRTLRPCQLIYDPAVSKQAHNRNATHIEPPCQMRIFLGIDLDYSRLSRQLFCHLSHRRCE